MASLVKLIAGIAFNVFAFGFLLFLPATTWRWWRAWAFLGVVVAATVLTTTRLYHADRDLLIERLKPSLQRGQPLADKLAVLALLAGFYGVIVLISLDRFRFRWLAAPGWLVSSLGLSAFVLGWWIVAAALADNAFAAPVVKVQDRQRVVDGGLYGVVRHPMYAGAVLVLVGMPLWLESYAATLAAIVPVALLVPRILFEERFLSHGLAGYDAYCERVRYRLIPWIW